MPIAIVGMSCRFAAAEDLHAYWRMTLEGRDAFGPVPADRWDAEAFFDTNKRANDKSYAPTGAFIDDVRSFPGLALGIPPRRIEVMDPQQRLAIEAALYAIHDAGRRPADLPRRTGVFMGVTANEFRMIIGSRILTQMMASGALGQAPDDPAALAAAVERVVPARPYSAPGVLSNMIAAAVAQELDLHGPAYTVDAACASALVALHDAVLQLRAGTIDAAVAGGVYLCLTPENHVAFSRIGAMSPSGRCLPFDARADGFVQGDGVGVVILKRLADATRDGDRIYAVIHGIAMNNDGRGDGPMAPVEAGQGDVIADAWRDAGMEPTHLGYVEAHGTGTDVGDATELRGLQATLGNGIGQVALGSSKANVGHTMSAAGVAGVIRAALAIHHRTLPPMANFESPKPESGLNHGRFRVPTQAEPWTGAHRIAGVSSFGFGGTNGHVVLGAAEADYGSPVDVPELVALSAPDEASLRRLAASTAEALLHQPAATVSGVARAWAVRPVGAVRMGVVASTVAELVERLRAIGVGQTPKGCWLGATVDEPPRVAFLFPGQGAQRVGMLRTIARRFPVVADSLRDSGAALADVVPTPLAELIWPTDLAEEAATARLTRTENCQPAIAAVGIALAALLESAGVRPVAAAGHSLGEFVAYVVAGAISPRDALRFTAARGRAMADLAGDPGAMVAVMTDAATAETLLVPGAVIANNNHPTQVVVSGTTPAIAEVIRLAGEAGVRARALDVSHAFHSPLFAKLDLEAAITASSLTDAQIPVASAITGGPVTAAAEIADVFRRHAGSPVDFVRAVRACEAAGAELFLQVGAGGPLASFARGIVAKDRVFSLAQSDDADEGRTLLEGLAWLWSRGVAIDLARLQERAGVVSVPPVVLPRETYWPVKDTRQIPLQLTRGAAPRAGEAAPEPPSPAPLEAPANDADPVADVVLRVVAKVSAYPLAAVSAKQGLVADLGFDSLMVADLASGLADAFPGIGGIPQELLLERPTVGAIIDWARTARSGPVARIDDDAPLSAWAPVWRATALPDFAAAVAGRRVSVGGAGRWVAQLAEGLTGAGAVLDDLAPEILIWACDAADPAPLEAALSGEIAPPDPAGPFIARLDALAGAVGAVDVIVARRSDDPWAEAVSGAARAAAREWPDRAIKSVSFDARVPAADLVSRVLAEHASCDRTTDVRWTSTARAVLGLEPVAHEIAEPPGPGDVALITGGTRGIGAQLAARVVAAGARALLVGRSEPGPEAARLIAEGAAVHLAVDVLDRAALLAAVAPHGPTIVIHAAGRLADGAIGTVAPADGDAARRLKIAGWVNALAAAPRARVALGLGSWAGRFGNRHQAHYAAGNAGMAALAERSRRGRAVVAELPPWASSEMVRSIPPAVQAAMRADGVDFAGDAAGLDALWSLLASGSGIAVAGRSLPWTTRVRRFAETLSVETHPFLADHVIEGVPVLPMAAAADLVAHVAGIPAPFELLDLTLFTGVAVRGATPIEVTVRGERAEIRVGDRRQLAWRARIRPLVGELDAPAPSTGGDPSPLALTDFYGPVAFHGPLLQGLRSVDALGDGFVRGTVATSKPTTWIPGSQRPSWTIDPLALDAALQLSGVAAWVREGRAGTPIGVRRLVVLGPLPAGDVAADVHFGPAAGDRWTGTVALRDGRGKVLLVAEDTAVELRRSAAATPALTLKPEWTNPALWPAVQDLKIRLEMAQAVGMRNPYFAVHEGTARNTTVVEGRELVNFSSYNYVGLSGDPRVVEAACAAVVRYGTSVSASRVASGERAFHRELERELAAAQGAEDALVFTAGHATNVTTIGHLFGKGDLILHDELIHDSALQGIKLSGAARRGFRHDDPAHLEQLLVELRGHHERCLIVVEGVYSMDGDIPDLPSVLALKKKYGCMLMVDEAHSFGVIGATGRGIAEHFGIDGREIDLWMGTLSKSLASCGGWIAGAEPVITYLRYTAPGFVYSAGLTAANGVAALTALRLMLEEPWRVRQLQTNARIFWQALRDRGVDTGPALGGSGVIPAITGNSLWALQLSGRLLDAGVNVQPIVYPAVADDAARLRFFLSSTHTEAELLASATKVADALAAVKADFPMPA